MRAERDTFRSLPKKGVKKRGQTKKEKTLLSKLAVIAGRDCGFMGRFEKWFLILKMRLFIPHLFDLFFMRTLSIRDVLLPVAGHGLCRR
jgi:hypothetical protein